MAFLPAIGALLRRWRASRPPGRKGQTLVEYALILALVAAACIAAFSLLGRQVVTIFSSITTLLDTVQSSH